MSRRPCGCLRCDALALAIEARRPAPDVDAELERLVAEGVMERRYEHGAWHYRLVRRRCGS